MFHLKSFLRVSLAFSTLLLASCHTAAPIKTSPPHFSPEQKKCAVRCEEENHRCSKQYQKIYEQCVMQAQEQAKLNYHAYLNNQRALKVKRKNVKKTYRDFLDTHHCKQQLMCKADYLRCYKACM